MLSLIADQEWRNIEMEMSTLIAEKDSKIIVLKN